MQPDTQIIYNVTIQVIHAIAEEWLVWLQQEHIPAVIATGCFTDARIVRLIETDDTDGPTYAVQYHANSKSDYNRYISLHAETMRQASFQKWGDKFIAFRSVMQVVN